MSTKKHHYRNVFKSDHLGIADLEEFIEEKRSLIFTISHVVQEYKTKVAGRNIDANIAYFIDPIKPMVLNATNSKIIKKLSGGSPFVEDWKNVTVELYIDPNVKMKGEVVGGLRIKDEAPKPLTESEIKEISQKINKIGDLGTLTTLYNSNIKFRTNQTIVELFRDRNRELTIEAS